MTDAFLDAILPGDADLGLPPGTQVDFDHYARTQGITTQVVEVLALLEQTAVAMGAAGFAALDVDARLNCVEQARRRKPRPVTAVIVHALKAYYTAPEVLRALSADAVPPFPQGNTLDDDDWSILEPVFERGPIFRPVTP